MVFQFVIVHFLTVLYHWSIRSCNFISVDTEHSKNTWLFDPWIFPRCFLSIQIKFLFSEPLQKIRHVWWCNEVKLMYQIRHIDNTRNKTNKNNSESISAHTFILDGGQASSWIISKRFFKCHTVFTAEIFLVHMSQTLRHNSVILLTLVVLNYFNTLRPRQNGRHFADAIFKCILLNGNVWIPNKI